MKKLFIILLILASGLIIYNKLKTPDYIKITQIEAQRCFEDMQQNPELICD